MAAVRLPMIVGVSVSMIVGRIAGVDGMMVVSLLPIIMSVQNRRGSQATEQNPRCQQQGDQFSVQARLHQTSPMT